jgi:hypothetical protein
MKRPAQTFIITRGRRTGEARLSLAGEWGNLPFPDAAAAEAHARALGGAGATIRHETSPRL